MGILYSKKYNVLEEEITTSSNINSILLNNRLGQAAQIDMNKGFEIVVLIIWGTILNDYFIHQTTTYDKSDYHYC